MSYQENANTENPRRRKKKKNGADMSTMSYIVFILGFSLILSAIAIYTANDMFALVKPDRAVVLEIKEPKTHSQMAKMLHDNGLIHSRIAFQLYSAFSADNKTFKKGKFEINANMDYGQIINTLNRVPTYTETVEVTIPEGYTLAQIAELLEETRVCGADDILKTANTYAFKHEMLQDIPMEKNRLEGYLFPDTYEFYINDSPVRVLNTMLNNFNNKYTAEMRSLTEESGYTMRQILTVASMVEREAKLESEQASIAGVIYNRLKHPDKFPYLNIDATVQYAVGHKAELTAEDLKIDSPYNTYVYPGLPAGPICNPGVPAILAALRPENNKYYYYVADPDTDSHVFAKTLAEHNANVAKMKAKAGK
ncbi:endolytic transglycosylase MltG [Acidaminobacterium chupaoyuni]